MSGGTWNNQGNRLRGLYRDRENGWLFGVCAGLAEFLDFRVSSVRLVVAVLALLSFWLVAFVYVAAVFLLKDKPLVYSGRDAEYEFWRRSSCGDRWSHR